MIICCKILLRSTGNPVLTGSQSNSSTALLRPISTVVHPDVVQLQYSLGEMQIRLFYNRLSDDSKIS